jgi:tetratricopeptide (TPR) repeat protein
MMRAMIAVALLLSPLTLWAATAPGDEMRPVPAAQAEKRVAKTRDLLTDTLWMGTEPYWHTGRWDDCIRICKQIVEVDPYFVEAYTCAAWMLWSQEKDAEAIELFNACIKANPDSWEVYHDFGTFYMARHKYEEAAAMFRKASARGAPQMHQHMLPNALELAGREKEALEEWRALLKRFPDDAVAKRKIERLEKRLKPGGRQPG